MNLNNNVHSKQVSRWRQILPKNQFSMCSWSSSRRASIWCATIASSCFPVNWRLRSARPARRRSSLIRSWLAKKRNSMKLCVNQTHLSCSSIVVENAFLKIWLFNRRNQAIWDKMSLLPTASTTPTSLKNSRSYYSWPTKWRLTCSRGASDTERVLKLIEWA